MVSPDIKKLSLEIRNYALSLGFDLVGIARAKKLTDHIPYLQSWLSEHMNADMEFMSRNIDTRTDPARPVHNARSVIVTGMNYYPHQTQGSSLVPVISKYSYGEDYHVVVGEKLKELLKFINSIDPAASGKICVDSSPVLEKAWAREAGLGCIGKNSLLINNKKGSFIFLGEIILDIGLDYDEPYSEDLCGNCNLCIQSCPTGAINQNRTIDARRCISWLTVENKGVIPEEFKTKLENRIFGCDICQDVCPRDKDLIPHNNPRFVLSGDIMNMSRTDWMSLDLEKFTSLFKRSAIKRAGLEKIAMNIKFITG